MGSCWGNARSSEGWWSLQEPLSTSVCRCEGPSKREVRRPRTSPSTARNSSIPLPYEDSGSTGSLGSSSRSKRRCDWTRSRRSNRGTRPGTRGCSSARPRGSRGPGERDFARSAGRSCGSGNCRTGRRSRCCCTSPPWHSQAGTRRSVDLRDDPARSSPSPRLRATCAGNLALDRWWEWIKLLLFVGFVAKAWLLRWFGIFWRNVKNEECY